MDSSAKPNSLNGQSDSGTPEAMPSTTTAMHPSRRRRREKPPQVGKLARLAVQGEQLVHLDAFTTQISACLAAAGGCSGAKDCLGKAASCLMARSVPRDNS